MMLSDETNSACLGRQLAKAGAGLAKELLPLRTEPANQAAAA